jgi:hypothetical protein
MKLFAVAVLTLGAAWPLSVFSPQATRWQLITDGPNEDPGVWWQFVANEPKGPPAVWWQFITNGPNGERQVSPHFANEEECAQALKAVEALLAKKFPDRYPLVGSCEPYR